ncbi:SUKH-4 family immunity protein [Kitasatospora camelliae]|uniref:SUKH-4 family immunity protein n=1 Tax=Kitasatospora camelliae TaxID=3156397 RepID=A0AAU8JVX4_9ACTN
MSGSTDAAGSAYQEVRAWLAGPAPSGRLYVSGPGGSGKTRLLTELRDAFTEALHVDATGLGADAVVGELIGQLDPSESAGLNSLSDLVRKFRGEGKPRIVLVANPQWAGILADGGEPARLSGVLDSLAHAAEQAPFKLVTETSSAPPVRHPGTDVVELPGEEDAGVRALVAACPPPALAALRALAHAQLDRVPADAWSALCACAEVDAREDELAAWAERFADVAVEENPEGRHFGFRSRDLARALRRLEGVPSAVVHDRMTTRLLTGDMSAWAARSLPGHTAVAGRFDELLADAAVLARIPRQHLLEGFDSGYPEGFEQDTDAAALHYLTHRNLSGLSQAEWVAWLSHDAFTRGRIERAQQLAASSSEPLPFTPLWSHRRPAGTFERPALPHTAAPIRVTAVSHEGRPAVQSEDGAGGRWVWDAATGEVLEGPVGSPTAAAGGPTPAVGEHLTARWRAEVAYAVPGRVDLFDPVDGRPLGALQLPGDELSCTVAGSTLIVADSCGLYALTVEPSALHPEPFHRLPELGWRGEVKPRPYDPAACADLRALLERAFGPESLHRIPPADLPPGLRDEPTRHLLVDVGVPEVVGLVGLWLDRLTPDSLAPVPWESVPEAAQPAGAGPYWLLGEWMGCQVVLDGHDGRVLRMLPPGAPEWEHPRGPLVGSTLRSFLTMVALTARYVEIYQVFDGPDRDDALAELEIQLTGIAPDAAGSDCWGYALDPDNWE